MTEEPALLRSPLHDRHVAAGAEMGEEGGWSVPLSYRGALAEYREVRRRAGVFDVSHLGRIRIRGDGALDLLERICTADVARQEDDTALRTLLCTESGGVLDDCILLRLSSFWVLTTNACNRRKVLDHIAAHAGEDVRFDDQTLKTAHVAVTGPEAPRILDAALPMRVSDLPAGGAKAGSLLVARYFGLRVGYTGQWGLEVMIPNMVAGRAWDFITSKAGDNAIAPAGMAARDILRLEAGLPRYGHEVNETIDPITAGLDAAVDLRHDFLGAEAVRRVRERGPARRRVGLAVAHGGPPERTPIPRQGTAVLRTDGSEVGTVTSATYSATLERVIAMAYVAPDAAEPQMELLLAPADGNLPAEVVALPFVR